MRNVPDGRAIWEAKAQAGPTALQDLPSRFDLLGLLAGREVAPSWQFERAHRSHHRRRPSIDGRPAVVAKYVDALSKGHAVTACIFEVFGGFDREVADLLLTWGSKARGKTPPGEEPPWSARNYVPYWSQIISKEVQRGAAREIVDRVREEANAREQARARGC